MKKIAVSLSGGIDSTVVSFFLKKIFKNITCLYYRNNIKNEDNFCNSDDDIIFCYKIVKLFSLKLIILDSTEVFKKKVFNKLIKSYKEGISYNPDIYCNKYIKFNYIIKKTRNYFDIYAFGHYALIKKKLLYNCLDIKKDQTYFIYKIFETPYLNKIIFPLCCWYKNEVKFLCNYLNAPNNYRKSSRGICFIQNNNFDKFIKKFIKTKGYIKKDNLVLPYKNMYHLSISQRIKKNLDGKKNYIYNKKNKIIYVTSKKNILLKTRYINLKIRNFKKNYVFDRKIFYVKVNSCSNFLKVFLINFKYYQRIYFIYPINKISKGQHLVFYLKHKMLFGGKIL